MLPYIYNLTMEFQFNLNFRLCPALKSVFEHGLKRSSLLGGPGHPWLFLEEVSDVHKSVNLE